MASTITDRASGLGTNALPNGEIATLSVKVPVVAATTANITLSGTQTIDGVAVVANDRVLVKAQTDATENGIYICVVTGWTRSSDCADAGDLVTGTEVRVIGGSTAIGRWYISTVNPIAIGTDNLTWVQITGIDVTDGDKGDITVSGSGATWSIDGKPTGAFVGDTDTQTLTGKTLTSGLLNGYRIGHTTQTTSGTWTIDYADGNAHELIMDGNITGMSISNWPSSGDLAKLTLLVNQDGSGGHTFAFPAGWIWPNGVTPTVTASASAKDAFVIFTADGGTTIYAAAVGQAFS